MDSSPRPHLGVRFLYALRAGALVGVPVGLALVVLVILADDTDVTFVAYAVTLAVAAGGLLIGVILWLAAAAYSRISRSYVRMDSPLANEPMAVERSVLGLGAAGVVACLQVAVVAVLLGESLF